MRSPGKYPDQAMTVGANGPVDYDGPYVNAACGIRPAINVNLSSAQLNYAGTICSDGTEQEENGGGNSSGDDDKDDGGSKDDENPGSEDAIKYEENIKKIIPDMSNLGFGKLKGPEISILGNKFNLFKTDMKVSLPFFNKTEIKINQKEKTAELLFGVDIKSKDKKSVDLDWAETYKEIKSFVKVCEESANTYKLWNKFSNLRGKTKDKGTKIVFDAKGNAVGYMKIQMDEQGNIQKIIESGITGGFEAGANVKKAKIWWIVYSDFGINGSIEGKWRSNLENLDSIVYDGEVKLTVKPSVALGADAVVVDVKGGIKGEITGKVTFPWEKLDKSVNAYLTAEAFVKVESPIPWILSKINKNFGEKVEKSKGWSYKFDKLELYPNLGKVTEREAVLQYDEPEPISRQMIRAMEADSEGAVDTTEEALVYENAKPEMIRLSDGRLLMVYLDDTENEPKLMYRIYDGGIWSDSKMIWTGGNLDMEGHLYQYNDTPYVIFESSNRPITEEMTIEQIVESMDLYVAGYSEGAFDEPVKLGESGTWKYAYQFTEHNGNLQVVWAENSANDILLESGNTVLNKSELTDTWQAPSEISRMEQIVTETVSGMLDERFSTAYVIDGQVYINDKLLDISSIGENADSLQIYNGKLYIRIDGSLCEYDGKAINPKNVECTASYQIYENRVYWIQQNNFKSEIISKQMDAEISPVAITDEGGYIGGFTIAPNTEGNPFISYTYQKIDEMAEGDPYGATILKFAKDTTRYQAEITDVAYDILSFEPGRENPINVIVCNTGTDVVNQLMLKVSDGNTVLYSGNVIDVLQAGESKECVIPVEIPEGFSKENLTFILTADETFKKETLEEYEVEYCSADIEIIENTVDEVVVKNNSENIAKNVKIILRNQKENGEEIRVISIGDLRGSEKKTVSVKEDWNKVKKDASTNKKYLYCEAIQDTDEYELWNNSIIMERQENADDGGNSTSNEESKPNISRAPIKVSKISLSGISKKIAAGKKIKLKAVITPANAANKTVKWTSSNKKVAKVNNSGTVTFNKKSGGKSVIITATAADGSGVKARYKITSMKGIVKKIVISGKKSVKAGKSLKLKAKVSSTKKANKKLKWTSSNTKYATVSSSGKVKALKAGKGKKVKITAKATDGSGKKKTVTIKIK